MSTKRERLLDWIKNGDPKDVPVIIGPWSWHLAASYFGKKYSEMSWTHAAKAAEETGTHNIATAYNPQPFDVINFIDGIELMENKNKKGLEK